MLTTNCSNNYGPYQFPEKLIPLVILNALDGKPLPVYGDGQNVRDWLFVEDHCAAIRSVLEHGRIGETYNIGGNSERKNLEVVTAICDLVDEIAADNRPESAQESDHLCCRTGPGTIAATRSTQLKSAMRLAGSPRSNSKTACAKPWHGISTTAHG